MRLYVLLAAEDTLCFRLIYHLECGHAPIKSVCVVLRCLPDTGEDILHPGCFRLVVLIVFYVEVMHDLSYLFHGLVFDSEGFYQHLERAEVPDVGKCRAAHIECYCCIIERSDSTLINESKRGFRVNKSFNEPGRRHSV